MTLQMPDSYWAATAEPGDHYPALDGQLKTSVCVIGGGYLGLSTALHLAEKGVDVVLLEAGQPGWGASGRNGGQIIPGFKSERSDLIASMGEEAGSRLFAWSGSFVDDTLDLIGRHGIRCQASRAGWLQPAHSVKSFNAYEKRVAEWQAEGIEARMLNRSEASAALGSDWYMGAYYDPRGGRLHPLSYARGLARAAAGAGARIFGDTLAKRVERSGGVWTVRAATGDVQADQVLICTNAYTDSGQALVPGLAQSIVPIPSYMVATAPLSDNLRKSILPGGETAADLKKLTNHFRLEEDGSFLFGGRGDLTETDDPSSFRCVTAKLGEIFPQLKDQPIAYRWSGRVAITTDAVPHLHNPAPGLWAALGCNGRGVGFCTTYGKLMSELLSGMSAEDSPVPVTSISRIPFHSFHLMGARAALWWKNRQDTRDRRAKP